jgi:hypothetical protein
VGAGFEQAVENGYLCFDGLGMNDIKVARQHRYPKTKTNMFVIACRLNFSEVEGSRIRIFLAPRRKGAKFEGER